MIARHSHVALIALLLAGCGGGGSDEQAVPIEGNVIASVEAFIVDMRAENAVSQSFSGMGWANNPGQYLIPSGVALGDATSGGRGDIMTRNNGVDSVTCWHWADRAEGHVAGNHRLTQRSTELWLLSAADVWTKLWGPLPIGSGVWWNDGGNTGDYSANATLLGGGIAGYPSLAGRAAEIWQSPFTPAVNPTLVANSKGIHIRSLFRVAKWDANGADDRAKARYRVKIGYDWINSTHPLFPGGSPSAANPFASPEKGTYPGYAMDGGGSSWRPIPYNPSNPDAWYAVGVTSVFPHYYSAGAGSIPPWTGDPFPYGIPDYTLSHDDWRNNHPPLPI